MEIDFVSMKDKERKYCEKYIDMNKNDETSILESILNVLYLKKYINNRKEYMGNEKRKELNWNLFHDGYQKAMESDCDFGNMKSLDEAKDYYSCFFI